MSDGVSAFLFVVVTAGEYICFTFAGSYEPLTATNPSEEVPVKCLPRGADTEIRVR